MCRSKLGLGENSFDFGVAGVMDWCAWPGLLAQVRSFMRPCRTFDLGVNLVASQMGDGHGIDVEAQMKVCAAHAV